MSTPADTPVPSPADETMNTPDVPRGAKKHKGRPKGGVWKVVTVQQLYQDNVKLAEYRYFGEQVECTTYFPSGMVQATDRISLDAFIEGMKRLRAEGMTNGE